MITQIRFNDRSCKQNTPKAKNNIAFGTHVDERIYKLLNENKGSLSEGFIEKFSNRILALKNDGNNSRNISIILPDYNENYNNYIPFASLKLAKGDHSKNVTEVSYKTKTTDDYSPYTYYIRDADKTEIKFLKRILSKLELKKIDKAEKN